MDVTWHWPQITEAIALSLSVVVAICNHGRPRSDYDGPVTFVTALIVIWVLYCGGFWTGGSP